jgi:hypothetical protein
LVHALDPVAMEEARRLYGERSDLALCDSPEAVLKGADGLIIVTKWNVLRSPNFDVIKASLSHPVIFDGRNHYDPVCVKLSVLIIGARCFVDRALEWCQGLAACAGFRGGCGLRAWPC